MNKSEEAQKRRFWIIISCIAAIFMSVMMIISSDRAVKQECLSNCKTPSHYCDKMGIISKIFSKKK